MDKDDKILNINNLTIGYSGKPLVRDIQLSLKNASLTALMGPNGSGKSTLIKTLIGLQPPLEGEVIIQGECLSLIPADQLAFKVATVLTTPIVSTELRVYELVAYGRYPYTGWFGNLRPKDHQWIKKAIHLVGMTGFEQRSYGSLSDGEKQRVLVARGLAQECPILILDEPTAHLDIRNKAEMVSLLERLVRQEAKSILFTTHEPGLVRRYADVLWLFDGRGGVEAMPVEQAFTDNKLVEVFGDAASLS